MMIDSIDYCQLIQVHKERENMRLRTFLNFQKRREWDWPISVLMRCVTFTLCNIERKSSEDAWIFFNCIVFICIFLCGSRISSATRFRDKARVSAEEPILCTTCKFKLLCVVLADSYFTKLHPHQWQDENSYSAQFLTHNDNMCHNLSPELKFTMHFEWKNILFHIMQIE